MSINALVLFLAGSGWAAGLARAVELSDNLGSATGGTEAVAGERRLAAAFSTGPTTAGQLASVTLLLASTSPGTAALDLHADAGLEPGAFIAALTSPANFASTPAEAIFSASGIALTPDTVYWVVLRAPSGTFEWAWTTDNAGLGAGFDTTWDLSEDGGAAWYTHDVYPLQLRVTATDGTGATTFRRADANLDGGLDIADPVFTLNSLFLGTGPLGCQDAADANDDGKVDLSDAVYALAFLFQGGAAIPAPGPEACGPDPTEDELPACKPAPGACGG
jgi:hypothetical protein